MALRHQTSAARILFAFVCVVCLAVLGSCQTSDTLSSAVTNKDENARPRLNGPLKPFKDDKFSYRPALEIRNKGDFIRVPYDEQRDINQRDEQPVRKVRASYIKRLPKSVERDFTYSANGRTLGVFGAGKVDGGASMTVIYLHGKDGDRSWGFDDERFGGNYNRLKNLMVENAGAYLSPDFTNFGSEGEADIASLIEQQSAKGAGRLVLACGSMGTDICWAIANSKSRQYLSGLILLSGFANESFLRSANNGSGSRLPLYIAHGSRDPVYDVAEMRDLFGALNAINYPVRMTVFDTGNHGTPVRMIDWRQALNWIATVK